MRCSPAFCFCNVKKPRLTIGVQSLLKQMDESDPMTTVRSSQFSLAFFYTISWVLYGFMVLGSFFPGFVHCFGQSSPALEMVHEKNGFQSEVSVDTSHCASPKKARNDTTQKTKISPQQLQILNLVTSLKRIHATQKDGLLGAPKVKWGW